MKILYSADASFCVDNVGLEVPDNVSDEEIITLIVDDLCNRYRLEISYSKESTQEQDN